VYHSNTTVPKLAPSRTTSPVSATIHHLRPNFEEVWPECLTCLDERVPVMTCAVRGVECVCVCVRVCATQTSFGVVGAAPLVGNNISQCVSAGRHPRANRSQQITHSQLHKHTRTHAPTRTLSLSLSHTHTQNIHTRTNTRTHTRTHTRRLFHGRRLHWQCCRLQQWLCRAWANGA